MSPTIADVQQALALPDFDGVQAQQQMAPIGRAIRRDVKRNGRAHIGCVLALLYCHQQELHLVLTRRRDDMPTHPGQISFPGGRRQGNESLVQAALRETEEEIGIAPTAVTVIGELSSLYIPPSDFEVHPFVGWLENGERPSFRPQPSEVAEILEVPLRHLLDPATQQTEPWQLRDTTIQVPFFLVNGYKVWGATAMMISELLTRLTRVIGDRESEIRD